jgi:hypothetical protein
MNYQLKIDVKKLNKAFVYPIQGKSATVECVCIPISEFYHGKNGELYCNLQITENKQVGQYGDTHFAKQSLEKSSYNALSDDGKKNIPIVGNMEPSKFGNNSTTTTTQTAEPQPQAQPEGDGLPF